MSKIVGCFQVKSKEQLIQEINRANQIELVDIVEIRLDYLAPNTVNREILQQIKECSQKPLILTIRDKNEGGRFDYPLNQRLSIYREAIANKFEFLDLEFINSSNILKEIDFSLSQTKVILSWHGQIDNFDKNYLTQKITNFPLENLIRKLVFTCNSSAEALKVEKFQFDSLCEIEDKNITIFGMGKFSLETRVHGYFYGNFFTYLALEQGVETAPGQLSIAQFIQENSIFRSMLIGEIFKVQAFGTSHGAKIGCFIQGFPKNEIIDIKLIQKMLEMRRPGKNTLSSSRQEFDRFQFTNGVKDGKATGHIIRAIIKNVDVRSKDYSQFNSTPRPSHVDFPAKLRFGTSINIAGSGIFSGRLTAPYVIGGSMAIQLLKSKNIRIAAYTKQIGNVIDEKRYTFAQIKANRDKNVVLNPSSTIGQKMIEEIVLAKEEKDSIGGLIAVIIENYPGGYGDPWFNSLESKISRAIMGIPAVRGIEFGAGFAAAKMRGSEHNDPYTMVQDKIGTISNHAGGIVGGISLGTPILFQLAIKPTASIGKIQRTLNLTTKHFENLEIPGRHDPCIVPRIIPVVEAITAIILLDQLMIQQKRLN